MATAEIKTYRLSPAAIRKGPRQIGAFTTIPASAIGIASVVVVIWLPHWTVTQLLFPLVVLGVFLPLMFWRLVSATRRQLSSTMVVIGADFVRSIQPESWSTQVARSEILRAEETPKNLLLYAAGKPPVPVRLWVYLALVVRLLTKAGLMRGWAS